MGHMDTEKIVIEEVLKETNDHDEAKNGD